MRQEAWVVWSKSQVSRLLFIKYEKSKSTRNSTQKMWYFKGIWAWNLASKESRKPGRLIKSKLIGKNYSLCFWFWLIWNWKLAAEGGRKPELKQQSHTEFLRFFQTSCIQNGSWLLTCWRSFETEQSSRMKFQEWDVTKILPRISF